MVAGWKAMDLTFNLTPSYRDLKDPTTRQNFDDTPGQIPKLILTLRLRCNRGWQRVAMVADRGWAGWQGAFLQPAFSPPPFIAGSQNKRPSQMKNSHPVDGRLCRCVHSR